MNSFVGSWVFMGYFTTLNLCVCTNPSLNKRMKYMPAGKVLVFTFNLWKPSVC